MSINKHLVVPALAAVLVAGGGWASINWMSDPDSYNGCDRYERAASVVQGRIDTTRDGPDKIALQAQLADLWLQASDANCDVASPATPNPSTTTPTGSAATPEPAKDDKADEEPADTWTPHYYSHDKGKTASRDFGPPVKVKTAVKDFRTRMHNDPALLCANGGLILDGADGGRDCTVELAKSAKARDSYEERVFDNIAKMEVVEKSKGRANSAYMVDVDGVPTIIEVRDVARPEDYYVLRVTTKDGRAYEFRLKCGFQWDEAFVPNPSNKKSTTPVKKSPPKALPCVNGGDRDEDAKCTPPKPKPSTTPTPGKTTSTTPPPTTTTPPTTPPTTSTPSTTLAEKDPSKDGGSGEPNENTGPDEYVPPSEATQSHSPKPTYSPPAPPPATTAPPVVVNPDPTPTRTSDPTDTSTGVVPVPSTTLPGGF